MFGHRVTEWSNDVNTLSKHRSLIRYARLAGLMYLSIIVIYMAGLLLGESLRSESFTETVGNITDSEMLYRASLTLMLLGSVFTIPLAGALYIFLKRVDPNLALFALLWRTCEAALGAVAKTALFARLGVYTGGADAFDINGQIALSGLFGSAYLASFNSGIVFFCGGSILFFYLLLKSRFIPRRLAGFGLAASVWTLVVALTSLIAPDLPTGAWWTPMFVAEIGTGLWLLIKGINLDYWQRLPADSQQRGSVA